MKIVFLNGADAGKDVELTPSGLTIGRETDNHLQLPVGGVSRYHARIEFVEGAFMLRDLGSTNGTKLNGNTIQKLEALKKDDIIAIGEQQFRVVDPDAGKTDSKISSNTVKIPTNVPVPEPAAPQFVFRPDSEIQPPPPPPVTDSSETATVNIAPDIADAGGSDFFAKRDGDGNFFKKEDEKKNSGKSSVRGNLIFVLVLIVMVIGGAALFIKLNMPEKKAKKKPDAQITAVENGEFFFYYETQAYDERLQTLVKKKIYCRRVADAYVISMLYHNHGGENEGQAEVRIESEEEFPLDIVDDYRSKNEIVRFVEERISDMDPIGNAKDWTRLVIGDGQNISCTTVAGGSEPASFRGAEEAILELIMVVTEDGKKMRSPSEVREDAERAYAEADAALRSSDQQAKARALLKFDEAAAAYSTLKSPKDQKRFTNAYKQAEKLREELSKLYLEGMQKANAAYKKRNYQEAIGICQSYRNYFIGERYSAFEDFENKCKIVEREKKNKKGK